MLNIIVSHCCAAGVAGDLLCQKEEWRQHSAECENHTCNRTGRVSEAGQNRSSLIFISLSDEVMCRPQKNQTLCVYQQAFK